MAALLSLGCLIFILTGAAQTEPRNTCPSSPALPPCGQTPEQGAGSTASTVPPGYAPEVLRALLARAQLDDHT